MKFIDSDKCFNDFILMLEEKNVTELAVDFELECNLHCYGNHVCLIQIFDGEETYLLDPLKISSEPMKAFLENEKILKTGFSMNSDIKILSEDLGIKMSPLFDVSMIAAQVVYGRQVGLDFLLKEVLKIEIKDKKKWQMNNWMRRPISKDAMEYAAGDVKYLFLLKEELLKIAEEKKLKKMILNGIKTKKWNYETSKIPSFFTKKMFLTTKLLLK